ncbi:unnamed protein product [Acanthosepion pharaonis]|uniref:Uncharacterized protein n=1 Tax=Acanthosepion pharaonis TaxID=158019 RepID=A0A812BDI9_ACAPH|nr:unnamed protein product [Sepia pharaonis]
MGTCEKVTWTVKIVSYLTWTVKIVSYFLFENITFRVGRGLSLNRSQCGGCSTKYDTPSLSQVVYERSLVSRSTGGSKFDGDGKIPPVADVKSGGPFADAATFNVTTAKVADAHGDDERHRRGPRRPQPPLATTMPAMAGSSGTKRDAFQAFSRYRAEAAWHRRSFERAREPLLRSRGSSRTGRDSRGHGRRNTCRSVG